MALTDERVGQIAVLLLQAQLEKEGVKLRPSEIKREVANFAKRMGIPVVEAAEFAKIAIEKAYVKTIAEFDKIITGKVGE